MVHLQVSRVISRLQNPSRVHLYVARVYFQAAKPHHQGTLAHLQVARVYQQVTRVHHQVTSVRLLVTRVVSRLL